MSHFLYPDQQEELSQKFDNFIQKIKSNIEKDNKSLKSIVNQQGKEPLPLHKLIIVSISPTEVIWKFDPQYEIPIGIEEEVIKLYKSFFQ